MHNLKPMAISALIAAFFTYSYSAQAQPGINIGGQPAQIESAIKQLQQTTESVKQTGEAVKQEVGSVSSKVESVRQTGEAVRQEVGSVLSKVESVRQTGEAVRQEVDLVSLKVLEVATVAEAVNQNVGGIMSTIENPLATAGGAILITQERALEGNVSPGDAPGFPVTISRSGSYALATNLEVTDANADAIELTIDHVTLDLNGFSIFGPGFGDGEGIAAFPGIGGNSTIVLNGIIRGMGSNGIRLDSKSHIENIQTIFNGGDGINVTSGAQILNTIANDNFGDGIHTGSDSSVSQSEAAVNGNGVTGGNGVVVGSRSLVTDNVITRNNGFGITGPSTFGYSRNVLGNNNSANANPQVFGGIELGANLCGTNTICP